MPASAPNPLEAKEAFPIKTTSGKRARKILANLVLWIVVPGLLLSIILVTIRTHDPEKEDCQEDTPVNCPLDCFLGYKEVRCPPVFPNNPSVAFSCQRNTFKYWVPFLGIKLLYVGTFLYLYMVVLFASIIEGMTKEIREEEERKQRERDEIQSNGEAASIGNRPCLC